MRARIANRLSNERITKAATALGLTVPRPGRGPLPRREELGRRGGRQAARAGPDRQRAARARADRGRPDHSDDDRSDDDRPGSCARRSRDGSRRPGGDDRHDCDHRSGRPGPGDAHHDDSLGARLRLIEKRVGLLFAAFALAFCVVMVRAAWLQTVKGGEYSADARSQQVATVEVPGIRGSILDRRGNALAVSEEAATIFATPYQVDDPPKAAEEAGRRPRHAGRRHPRVADRPERLRVRRPEGRPRDRRQGREARPRRHRGPAGLAARLPAGEGRRAADRRRRRRGPGPVRDRAVRGRRAAAAADGEVAITKDALGQEINRDVVTGAAAGHDVQLTIDGRIQAYTEKVLGEIGDKYMPKDATAIVMDPTDGDVLAMASWPPVDPNDLSDADPDQLTNMATGFTYEPGSTFKAFTVAGRTPGRSRQPRAPRSTSRPRSRWPTGRSANRTRSATGRSASATSSPQSSNVGTVMIGEKLGEKRVRLLGLEVRLRAADRHRLPGRGDGDRSDSQRVLRARRSATCPIGQGLSVTPMQMMEGYAAIANGGILRTPRLIESIDGQPVEHSDGTRVISEKTSAQLRTMLEGVLGEGGTASEVSVPGYVLAGKTGTAQKVVDGTYSDTQFIASFVGFAPAADPRLLVSVIVDDPKGGDYYGGSVAAPAFGEIASLRAPVPRNRSDRVSRTAAGSPPPAVPRIAGDEARRPQRRAATESLHGGAARIVRGDGSPRSPTSPSTAAPSARGRCSSASPARSPTVMTSPPAVVEAGAAALVVERELDLDVPQLVVADSRAAMAPIAARWFGDPSSRASDGRDHRDERQDDVRLPRPLDPRARRDPLRAARDRQADRRRASRRTVERTTPEAIDLQRTFRRMLDAGDEACVIEVSSHALTLGRADAIHFDVAAFTNLTQDHLDFHRDMEDYFEAKRRLFVPGRRPRPRSGGGGHQRRRSLRPAPRRRPAAARRGRR